MKKEILFSRIGTALTCLALLANGASDTLRIAAEYPSPIPNPRAIEWDGTSYWTATMTRPCIYKLNNTMAVVDSLKVSHDRISAICFRNSELWLGIDTLVPDPDALHGPRAVKVCRIYRVSAQTGEMLDSISFKDNAVSFSDTGYLYGLTCRNDTFLVAIFAGWSSGVYRINPTARSIQLLHYGTISSISSVNKEIWGIGWNSNTYQGNCITKMDIGGNPLYLIPFKAADVAFVGAQLTACDQQDSKFFLLQLPFVNLKNRSAGPLTPSSQRSCRNISICSGNQRHINPRGPVLNLKGQCMSAATIPPHGIFPILKKP